MTRQEADAVIIKELLDTMEEIGPGPLADVYARIVDNIRNGMDTSFAYQQRLLCLMTGEVVSLLHNYG